MKQQHPIDFLAKINDYKIKFPLEYEKVMSDWDLVFSEKINFSIFMHNKSHTILFEYRFITISLFPHHLKFFDAQYIHELNSLDGIHYSPIQNMFMDSTMLLRPLFDTDIKKLIGIKHISKRGDGNIDIILENLPRRIVKE